VSANARLGEKVARACEKSGISWRMPPPQLRTDNALMIAYAASHRADRASAIDADIRPNFDASLLAAAGH
jgi:tRNA A37 threonylcarbamoyltransferase TsaD